MFWSISNSQQTFSLKMECLSFSRGKRKRTREVLPTFFSTQLRKEMGDFSIECCGFCPCLLLLPYYGIGFGFGQIWRRIMVPQSSVSRRNNYKKILRSFLSKSFGEQSSSSHDLVEHRWPKTQPSLPHSNRGEPGTCLLEKADISATCQAGVAAFRCSIHSKRGASNSWMTGCFYFHSKNSLVLEYLSEWKGFCITGLQSQPFFFV